MTAADDMCGEISFMKDPSWMMTRVPLRIPLYIHDPSPLHRRFFHKLLLPYASMLFQKEGVPEGDEYILVHECSWTLLLPIWMTLAWYGRVDVPMTEWLAWNIILDHVGGRLEHIVGLT
jgi:hypothetical protein